MFNKDLVVLCVIKWNISQQYDESDQNAQATIDCINARTAFNIKHVVPLYTVLFSQQLEKGQDFKFWVPHFKNDINKKMILINCSLDQGE